MYQVNQRGEILQHFAPRGRGHSSRASTARPARPLASERRRDRLVHRLASRVPAQQCCSPTSPCHALLRLSIPAEFSEAAQLAATAVQRASPLCQDRPQHPAPDRATGITYDTGALIAADRAERRAGPPPRPADAARSTHGPVRRSWPSPAAAQAARCCWPGC